MVPVVFDIEKLIKQAKKGDGLSCYLVARSYDSAENGVDKNPIKAIKWYTKGAKLKDPKCIYGLGASYFFGDGVKKDSEKADKLLKEAYEKLLIEIEKEKNNSLIQSYSKFCIGAYYYFGFGEIKKDEEKAFNIISECASVGHMAAIYDLGANFYFNGCGCERNLKLSKQYLELAANYGYKRAIEKLEEYKEVYNSGLKKL